MNFDARGLSEHFGCTPEEVLEGIGADDDAVDVRCRGGEAERVRATWIETAQGNQY